MLFSLIVLAAVALLFLLSCGIAEEADAYTACNVYHYNYGENPGWVNCTDGSVGTGSASPPGTSYVSTRLWLLNKAGYNEVGYSDILWVPHSYHDFPAFDTTTFPEMLFNYDMDVNWSGWTAADTCLVYSESVDGINGQSLGQDYIGVGQHTMTFADPQDLAQVMMIPLPTIDQNDSDLRWNGMRLYADEDLDYATWEERTDALIGYQIEYSTDGGNNWHVDGTIMSNNPDAPMSYTPVLTSNNDLVRIASIVKGVNYMGVNTPQVGFNARSNEITWSIGAVHNINSGLDYATIQEAIDAANPGDTLNIDPGTYIENIDIGKNSAFADSDFALDGTLTIAGTGTLTIKNCTVATGTTVVQPGGTLDIKDSPNTQYLNGNLWIDGNYYLNSSTLQVNLTFDGEWGIQVNGTGSMIVQDNGTGPSTVRSNNTDHEYWFNVLVGATFRVENSTIRDAGWDDANPGLAIYADGVFLYNATLTENYNGITLNGSANGQVLCSNITSNNNYGIYLWHSGNNNITHNVASNNTNCGIHLESSNNTITNNTA
ncbi:MAG: hypothetical protein KAT70_00545, partial [Thermoplasmata archaeon]|nr:hypothetical protein [Thermoplasmata archaeon]